MCIVFNNKVVSLAVQKHEGWGEVMPMGYCNRRWFVRHIPSFRRGCGLWMTSLVEKDNGVCPAVVGNLLMHAEWDSFFSYEGGLNLTAFSIVMYWFQTNDAPLWLRRQFWLLLLDEPTITNDGIICARHSFMMLFYAFSRIPAVSLISSGAFYHVKSGRKFFANYPKFSALNIWGCRGFISHSVGGVRRRVSVDLSFTTEWDEYGLLSPETVNGEVELWPFNVICDETALRGERSFE